MFRVAWTRAALTELATIWVGSNSHARRAVSVATAEIDRQLSSSPFEVGESREGADRVLFESPLAIYFRVYEADRLAVVAHVWMPTGGHSTD